MPYLYVNNITGTQLSTAVPFIQQIYNLISQFRQYFKDCQFGYRMPLSVSFIAKRCVSITIFSTPTRTDNRGLLMCEHSHYDIHLSDIWPLLRSGSDIAGWGDGAWNAVPIYLKGVQQGSAVDLEQVSAVCMFVKIFSFPHQSQ